jgi:two-component system OmpR family response regulator
MGTGSLVLVVDDDIHICELVRLYLEKDGFRVILAHDGRKAVDLFRESAPDIVILDIMLPGIDGWQVCREIRRFSQTPIIMLSARDETFNKVLGLELGADDYMVKPFEPNELSARIRAVLRRYERHEEASEQLAFPGLSVSKAHYTVILDGNEVDVPPKELELLYFLAANPNKVFTREQLLEKVWGFDFFGDTRTVDVHVKRLREKLEIHPDAKWQIKTVWGVGYKFEVK